MELPPVRYARATPAPGSSPPALYGRKKRWGSLGLIAGLVLVFSLLAALGYFTYQESPFASGGGGPAPAIHWGGR